MSVDTLEQEETDSFISPVNKTLDRSVTAANPAHDRLARRIRARQLRNMDRASRSLIPFSFREMLVIQPPLGPNERLPYELALDENESALSDHPDSNYFYCKEIDLYVLNRHHPVLVLALTELADLSVTTTHGTGYTYSSGCKGPLCRRARREDRANSVHLRRVREAYEKDGSTYQRRMSRYDQLKISVPQYAAVEPLLTALTVKAHLKNPPRQPTQAEKVYQTLTTRASLADYLVLTYGDDALTV